MNLEIWKNRKLPTWEHDNIACSNLCFTCFWLHDGYMCSLPHDSRILYIISFSLKKVNSFIAIWFISYFLMSFVVPNLIAEIELEQDTIIIFNRGFHCKRWIWVLLVICTCFWGQMWMNSSSDDTFPLIFGRFVLSRNYMEIKSKNFIIAFLIIWLNLWLMIMIGRSNPIVLLFVFSISFV